MKKLFPVILLASAALFSFNTKAQIKWVGISADYRQNLALKEDSTLWVWGDNSYGQLGDGSTTNRIKPVQLGSDTIWIAIEAGNYHSLGLKLGGTLWAWGRNSTGQIGDGGTTQRTNPVKIGTSIWSKISGGGQHSLGIMSDGTLWTWGRNNAGQIGDGTLSQRNSPIKIGTDNKWLNVSGGGQHSIALKTDSTLWAWGLNLNGQLGDGTTTDRNAPVQIGTEKKWLSIACGAFHTIALKSDGTLWAWGENASGQLGDGTKVKKSAPVKIGTDKTWISITAGNDYSMALKADGTLWAWGSNANGQFGDGSTTDGTSPSKVGASTWSNISAGSSHSLGVKTDKSQFCASGNNSSGQLGDSTTSSKTSFVCNTNCVPPAAPKSTNQEICYGQMTTLKATGLGRIAWYDSATGGSNLMSDSIYVTPILTTTTTYFVQDNTCGPSKTRTAVLVSVNALPKVTAKASDTIVCKGSKVIFTGGGAVSYVWAGGIINGVGFNITTAGRYQVSGTDGKNCVDTASIYVAVKPLPDLTTIKSGFILTANQAGATYQWLDCNNGNKPISGATGKSYTVPRSGDYAVLVTFNGCADTSTCVKMATGSIQSAIYDNQINVYPNPSNGALLIKSTEAGTYSVINELGQTLQTFELNIENNYTLKFENLSNGIYYIVGFNFDLMQRQKVVVIR